MVFRYEPRVFPPPSASRRGLLESSYVARKGLTLYHEILTARGRYVLWLALVLGFLGLETQRALGYMLFAIAAAPLGVAFFPALRRRPALRLQAELPHRLTAGRRADVRLRIGTESGRASGDLVAGWSWGGRDAAGLRFEPEECFLETTPGGEGEGRLGVRAERRGSFVIPALRIGRTDPLGLLSTARFARPPQTVLAYPRFYTLDSLALPAGRRYQPGGIPLASSLGDSTEFVGTREFREGDPLRRIHWRSWARRGTPVVKEYQEEYFSRIALVLDTYLPKRPRPGERRSFEAAVSVLASIADHMGRSEDVVDVFAAGPELIEVSTGRSLGRIDTVLDALACLEPCHEPPFDVLAPRLIERLSRLTTVVAVVLDWDEQREAFLRRLHDQGVALRVFVVHEGPTRRPVEAAGDRLGAITVLTPEDVERRIQAEEAVH
jgi:uncharacterized protein (DUF58 family)